MILINYFVLIIEQGCDASILLEGPNVELRSQKDSTVAGLDIVEEIKVTLDKYCPGVVSCADIIVLGARSAAYLVNLNEYYILHKLLIPCF